MIDRCQSLRHATPTTVLRDVVYEFEMPMAHPERYIGKIRTPFGSDLPCPAVFEDKAAERADRQLRVAASFRIFATLGLSAMGNARSAGRRLTKPRNRALAHPDKCELRQ